MHKDLGEGCVLFVIRKVWNDLHQQKVTKYTTPACDECEQSSLHIAVQCCKNDCTNSNWVEQSCDQYKKL